MNLHNILHKKAGADGVIPEAITHLSDREVTSHTASLWKYVPIPENPEPFPEYRENCEKLPFAEIIASRVRGKKHKHEGSNCDDWYDYACVKDWIIAVVSDGAGSKPLSRIGAKASCEAVVNSIKKEIEAIQELCPDAEKTLAKPYSDADFTQMCTKLALLIQGSFTQAYEAVENAYLSRSANSEFETALGRKSELKDYSGTLLCAVIVPVSVDGRKEHFIISLQIGDGMIASVNRNAEYGKALRILGNADSGSFAGETEFLTSDAMRSDNSLKSRTKIQRCPVSTVMLMSDGVADDYYPSDPQVLRLYYDLILNGIIAPSGEKDDTAAGDGDIIVPEPVSYPWVNDGDVKYSLQYAKNVIAETGLTLEKLWNDRTDSIIRRASLDGFGISNGSDAAERLTVWLDNYVERGSFDDRALLIINLND